MESKIFKADTDKIIKNLSPQFFQKFNLSFQEVQFPTLQTTCRRRGFLKKKEKNIDQNLKSINFLLYFFRFFFTKIEKLFLTSCLKFNKDCSKKFLTQLLKN